MIDDTSLVAIVNLFHESSVAAPIKLQEEGSLTALFSLYIDDT